MDSLDDQECSHVIQTKTERGMKFTTHCFVRVEDAEKRKDVIDRTIDAYIRNIRKKLRLDCITTVKGIGYKFEMGQEI